MEETNVVALIAFLLASVVAYAVHENFRENQAYIQAGYHHVASDGWVK
jgi:hypothetical protein